MKTINFPALMLGGAVTLLSACAGTPDQAESSAGMPEWVTQPSVENGIAATSCVKWSGHFDMDKKQALASARQELAQQIDTRVKSLEENYVRRTRSNDQEVSGAVFESVSSQVTEQNLGASVPERIEQVTIGEQENLCAMVAMRPEATRALFEQLVQASDAEIDPRDKEILYEEFKAYKAQKRLQEQTAEP